MKKIEDFIKLFTEDKFENIVKIKKEYFYVSDVIVEFIKDINYKQVIPGILLGVVKKEKFQPSFYLLEKLSKMSSNKVFVNEQAEWLFLCGRDVFENNVVKNDSVKDSIFLVQNKFDENLGLGFMKIHRKKVIVRNIIDRGDYLRREMN